MSKTYRNPPTRNYQYHPGSMWRQSTIDEHDGYIPRSRHKKGNLVSSWEDVYKSIYDYIRECEPDRRKKIQERNR